MLRRRPVGRGVRVGRSHPPPASLPNLIILDPWIRAMRVQRRVSPAAAATCRQRAAPSSSSKGGARRGGEGRGRGGRRRAGHQQAHRAAWERRTEVCRFLVEQLRLPVDPKHNDGETPLIHATRQGRLETVEYLLGHGVDPSVVSNMGAMTLHHAAGIGHIEIMKILLGKGVDVESESESGTPLVWAAGHGQQDAVKLLLEHNAKPNTETVDGITSLLSDVAAGSLPCSEICRRENMRWREKKGEEGER